MDLFVENSTIFTDCAIQAYIDRNSSKKGLHKVYIYVLFYFILRI